MNLDELKANKILRGPLFPEPVQVIVAMPMGPGVKLIGKDEGEATPIRKKRGLQMERFKAAHQGDSAGPDLGEAKVQKVGATVLDRLHQSTILFAAGRGEALKRFLVEDAGGNAPRFWTLAQALSTLYPASAEEKRWIDCVLARKGGWGFSRNRSNL